LREELEELVAAIETESVEDIADGVADLLYLTIGTALAYGIPIEAVFDEIHRSNMTKTLPPDAHGRPVKGATFRPPCFDWLRDAGAVPRRRE
jgi:predicted HAD superfamily Cof-like phosphohydrolase